ncbi:CAP domain-containing protein [Streptomyces sp. NPDC053431]|uniref:CAP domain-containing protein n=1 Tax=Streptomyces sp. NPDC053431 TaxID=3365703 RepID=UPI0037D3C902
MELVSGFERSVDVELVRAAQYGDTWAWQQLIGGYEPLVQAVAARALEGRPGADAAVRAIVRDTLGRAEFVLGTLASPEAFRPWLVGIGVASTLAHAAGLPVPAVPAAGVLDARCWLEAEDAVLASLWSLEQEGVLGRDETATALNWSLQDTTLCFESLRVRVDAARSVTVALARAPRCPALDEHAAAWDGQPGAAWRDELARHTAHCEYCVTGFAAAAVDSTTPAYAAAVSDAVGPGAWAAGASGSFGAARAAGVTGVAGAAHTAAVAGVAGTEALAPTEALAATEAFAAVPADASDHLIATGEGTTAVAGGRRATRAALRRRRQADERTRRRVVVAAGLAVVAVTGGAFTLNTGRGSDLLEANRVAAPDLDVDLTNEPGALTTSASPSTSQSASAARTPGSPGTPTGTPSKAPRPSTATGSPKRPAAPATTAPTRRKAVPTRGSDAGSDAHTQRDAGVSSVADQVIALVNAERAKAGCGALTANATLTRAAQGHSDDMAARDFFDHTNPDGAGPGDRVTAAGYPWSTYGENIAMGQSSAEQVMEAWMNSPGHRANILNCDFKEIGVGIHNSGGPYWTQVFGAR